MIGAKVILIFPSSRECMTSSGQQSFYVQKAWGLRLKIILVYFICFLPHLNYTGKNEWYEWSLMGPDMHMPTIPEPWHQQHNPMNETISILIVRSSRFPLGIPACLFCSPAMSVNWLPLPNRPCTSSDWCVSVQTLPATRGQMAHIPSIAARQNRGRCRMLLERYNFLVTLFHTYVYWLDFIPC